MEEKKETHCEELAKKMNECLEKGDNEKCKELVEEFKISCEKAVSYTHLTLPTIYSV